jgi:hypothetical protein
LICADVRSFDQIGLEIQMSQKREDDSDVMKQISEGGPLYKVSRWSDTVLERSEQPDHEDFGQAVGGGLNRVLHETDLMTNQGQADQLEMEEVAQMEQLMGLNLESGGVYVQKVASG